MALSQKLAQFKRQQEKIQSSLATITSSRSTLTPPPPLPHLPLAERFSFTNDTEKLQQIATIQKSPVGAQIKRVLGLLLESRQSLLPEEINDLCFVDVKNTKDVFEGLKSNVKVSFDGERFAYKTKHVLKSKEELLILVRNLQDGVPMGDLEDSYPGIATDVQELRASGEVWVLTNSDSQEDIVYPNDPEIVIKVDEDLKQLIRAMEIPREFMDCRRQSRSQSRTEHEARGGNDRDFTFPGSKATKEKKERELKRTKHTNSHLTEFFKSIEVP